MDAPLDPIIDAEVLAFVLPWNDAATRATALAGVDPDASADD
jgi:hypothetical protein